MRILGQMVRVPVTAHQKFNEAAYFYNGMLANRTNVVILPYYLSAFLSAFRSITFYLQTQYSNDATFREWYARKRSEMAADPVLKMLNARRRGIVHLEPIDLFFKRGFEFPGRFGGCIETNHLEVEQGETADGRLTTTIKVGADGIEEDVATQISWHFDEEDGEDVMSYCYLGLQKLDALLQELSELRVSMGLPPDEVPRKSGD
jgi:hypothetical protein